MALSNRRMYSSFVRNSFCRIRTGAVAGTAGHTRRSDVRGELYAARLDEAKR